MRNVEPWLLSFLLNSLWQIPLLFVAGWIGARALRRLGPAAEHRVWVSVLLMAGLLPVASALPWDWLRAQITFPAAHHPGDAHVTVIMGAGTGLGALPLPTSLLAIVAISYLALSLWFAARFLWRWLRLRALRRDAAAVPLTGETAICWAQYSTRFGIEGVTLASSSRVFGPVTMGLSRKFVLLPDRMLSAVPDADLHTVIAHEFAHIRRNDFLKNLIYELIALPVTYHPLLWLIRERITETREMVCDRMAAATADRTRYARSLLRLASLLAEGTPATTHYAIGISDAITFERRLMRLTETQSEMRGVRRLAAIAACVVLGVATCASALALHIGVDGLTADHVDSQPSQPIAVAPGVMQAQRINGPMPVYPPDAKKARIQGTVLLDAIIGKDGTVEKLVVQSGPSALQQSALDAVRQWTYKPFLLNGDPVDVKTTITVVYSLRK
ncbi:MAG: TonB family protein [Acidobacteriaceae bacterium]